MSGVVEAAAGFMRGLQAAEQLQGGTCLHLTLGGRLRVQVRVVVVAQRACAFNAVDKWTVIAVQTFERSQYSYGLHYGRPKQWWPTRMYKAV
jgi:hypothetical protein